MKTYYYGIGMIARNGRNKTDARNNAEEAAREALSGTYQPFFAKHEHMVLFVWRRPDTGWTYTINDIQQDTAHCNLDGQCISADDRDACIEHAMYHLATLIWIHGEPDTSPLLIHFPAQQREFTSWVRWQNRYAAAIRAGYDRNAAHTMASQGTEVICASAT